MMKLVDLFNSFPVVEDDPLACFISYKSRVGRIRQGELNVMHVCFKPMVAEDISKLNVEINILPKEGAEAITGERASVHQANLTLSNEYVEFLKFTNGGLFYGGNVVLFGLRDNYDIPDGHLVKYRPPEIIAPNVLCRNPRLRPCDIHIGTYFYNQMLLIFSAESGAVELTMPYRRDVYKKWPSFEAYIASDFCDHANCFDDAGSLSKVSPFFGR
jgi:hypothetical protein